MEVFLASLFGKVRSNDFINRQISIEEDKCHGSSNIQGHSSAFSQVEYLYPHLWQYCLVVQTVM